MLQKEQWMQIHVLKAQGLSLREIARRLGVSPNTVTRYLASHDVPRYKQREPRPTKLGKGCTTRFQNTDLFHVWRIGRKPCRHVARPVFNA